MGVSMLARRIGLIVASCLSLSFALSGCQKTKAVSVVKVPPQLNLPSKANASRPPTPTKPKASDRSRLSNWKCRPDQIERGNPKNREVAFTFDGDWDASATESIVKTLDRHHAKGTFFITGHFCHRFPKECKALANSGMEIGGHSYTHPYFQKISAESIRKQLANTEEAMVQRFGVGTKPIFRFPYGESDDRSRRVVAEAGFQGIYWSLDSLDGFGEEKSSDFVRSRIINRIKPGDIVLMHVSAHGTANALDDILTHIENRGLKAVPVSEMML